MLLQLIPPCPSSVNNVIDNSNEFNFNFELSNLKDAFKFSATPNSDNVNMDTDFVTIKPKRKLRNVTVNKISNGDEPGLKIAKHAATSRSFQLPTQNRYTNLNEKILTGNETDTPKNNTSTIVKQSKRNSYPKARFITI